MPRPVSRPGICEKNMSHDGKLCSSKINHFDPSEHDNLSMIGYGILGDPEVTANIYCK